MKRALEEGNLICLVKGHVACFCSCDDQHPPAICCGCRQYRESSKIDLHCLACGEDLRRYLTAEGNFDSCPKRGNKEQEAYQEQMEKMISEVNGDKLPEADERRSPGPNAGSSDRVHRAIDPESA